MLSEGMWILVITAIIYGIVLLTLIDKIENLERELKALKGAGFAQ